MIRIDELDKKLIYYYRNDFKTKYVAELTGVELRIIKNRLARLRKYKMLKRWWEEDERDTVQCLFFALV